MTQELEVIECTTIERISSESGFDSKKVEALRDIICKDATPEELYTFSLICAHTKLDPFLKQIYFIKRWDGKQKRNVGQPQTSIDGLRLIADRTGKYAPGPAAKFSYDDEGSLVSAEAFVKKQTADGTWHLVGVEAYWSEYCQTFTNKQTGEKSLAGLWGSKPRIMLSKCAEALALRKAFPAEMAGVYTSEEMPTEVSLTLSEKQLFALAAKLDEFEGEERAKMIEGMKKFYKIETLLDLPVKEYEPLMKRMDLMKTEKIETEIETETVKEEE